jgi:dephospho-CoA kinase
VSLVIGLTGGIASGKTLVESAFRDLGVPVVDADQAAREVVAPGEPALEAIREAFGSEVLMADGALDRRRMRGIVFADPEARKRLEAITHPAIRERLLRWREALSSPYGILSAAIMVESGLATLADRILVIDVPETVQLVRLMHRDGMPEALAQQMIEAQASRAERLARAHDVLRNDDAPGVTELAVKRLHRHYQELAEGRVDASERLRLP